MHFQCFILHFKQSQVYSHYFTTDEENTDESTAVEPEQNDGTAKNEQPMEQSDNVGVSSVSTGEAPDSSMCFWLMYFYKNVIFISALFL